MPRKLFAFIFVGVLASAQPPNPPPALAVQPDHLLGFIPNYKSVPDLSDSFVPVSTKTKFKWATRDSFDPYWWAIAGVNAGFAQLNNQFREYGQGAEGFAKRYAVAFADRTVRNYLTEGVLPTLLHEDVRYFRLGKGSAWKRTGYAITRILVTRTDSGGSRFNTSEVAGNAFAASLSNAYYPDSERNASRTMKNMGLSVSLDAGLNVLKEFWPDVRRKFRK